MLSEKIQISEVYKVKGKASQPLNLFSVPLPTNNHP